MNVVIIDYGLGNLGSIANMLRKCGYESNITSDPLLIAKADRLILPGVGSFDSGVKNLTDLGLFDVLNDAVHKKKVPILGICLGAQLMLKRSDEGELPGLNWINGEALSFKKVLAEANGHPIPNMGWIDVEIMKESNMLRDFNSECRFYFVHSYYMKMNDNSDELLRANYGIDYCCAFEKNNILGVQFHPEKSHRYGFSLFKNFIEAQ